MYLKFLYPRQKNKEILLEFSESLVLEGLSKPRMIRCLFTMQNLAKKLECDLDKAQKKHLKGIVSALQIGNYSPWTKRTYKCIIRRFYKWLYKADDYPDIVSWINIRVSKSEVKLPSEGDLLKEEEVKKILAAAHHPRDKAFISVLWESGARIGEVGNLILQNVVFDKYGFFITLLGKTGSRKIRLISSTPYLSTWISNHPFRDDKRSPLWINVGTTNHHKKMNYPNMRKLLSTLFERAGINKRCNPHMFRHSRATFMASHLTEFQMNQYFGWIQGSGMPATYVHLNGRDVDNAILEMNGIKNNTKKEENKFKPIICPRCDTINPSDNTHCLKCAGIIDYKYAIELEQKNTKLAGDRTKADTLASRLFQDPDIQAVIKQKLKIYGLNS